ncbi:hypothetical protein G7Z17_g3116 [Cylindrodendrum hubeiense]|uniref:Uncharacterized protein n=1 Tax=Cylindrodendrum hubeiense TaxID=595255 RepID=A0A9P5LIH4_9HYPO|nr:hypothetical protein G7Z17_g3116 [Cylindrodendrum hubeiense]
MTGPQQNNPNVQLLACLLDPDDADDSDYRFLIDGQHVKYMSTAPGTFRGAEDDRNFEPILLGQLLPPFPTGDWNKGYAARDPDTGKATFVRTETVQFAGVKSLWHPVKLNELDFTRQHRLRQGVHVATHPEVEDGKLVLIKLAVWPWEIPYVVAETAAYQWISDTGVGPKFLGHLTEGKDGRVVGFVTEWVEDARAAEPEDFDGCKKALGRLHELGIKLGDINKHNFLVRDGHDVVLVDFETAKRDCSPRELEDEMNDVMRNLEDTSCLGGMVELDVGVAQFIRLIWMTIFISFIILLLFYMFLLLLKLILAQLNQECFTMLLHTLLTKQLRNIFRFFLIHKIIQHFEM